MKVAFIGLGNMGAPMARNLPAATVEPSERRLEMKGLVYHGPAEREWEERFAAITRDILLSIDRQIAAVFRFQ